MAALLARAIWALALSSAIVLERALAAANRAALQVEVTGEQFARNVRDPVRTSPLAPGRVTSRVV